MLQALLADVLQVDVIPPVLVGADPVALALAAVVSIPLVEVVRAGTAVFLGDDTPRRAGRLWRVDRNVHLTGTVLVPALLALAGGLAVGWPAAAPVRDEQLGRVRRGLVALIGPATHLAIAAAADSLPVPVEVRLAIVGANVGTGLLLLLPAPPLPGGVLLGLLVPAFAESASRWQQLRRTTEVTPWALGIVAVVAVVAWVAG